MSNLHLVQLPSQQCPFYSEQLRWGEYWHGSDDLTYIEDFSNNTRVQLAESVSCFKQIVVFKALSFSAIHLSPVVFKTERLFTTVPWPDILSVQVYMWSVMRINSTEIDQ